MNIWSYEHLQDLTMEKPVGGSLQIFKATINKLFAGNEERIDNHTLMLDMLHSYISGLDSSQISAGKRWILKIDDRKKKSTYRQKKKNTDVVEWLICVI